MSLPYLETAIETKEEERKQKVPKNTKKPLIQEQTEIRWNSRQKRKSKTRSYEGDGERDGLRASGKVPFSTLWTLNTGAKNQNKTET